MTQDNISVSVERIERAILFVRGQEEIAGISQTVTSSNLKFSKRVTAFTQEGVAMLYRGFGNRDWSSA
jgi:hypothetical protein